MVRQHPAAKGAPPATAIHARALGACDPTERFEVVLTLRRADEAGFRSLVSRLEAGEPGARPVSRDEYEQRHGAAAQDVQQVLGFARAHGLRVLRQDPASRRVVLSGTVAQFNTAFGVQLQRFEQQDGAVLRHFRQHAGAVQLPDALQGVVTAVLGLDDQAKAAPHFRLGPPLGPAFRPARASAQSFTPLQLAQLYRFPPGDGKGQCIGLIELGGGYLASDLAAYFAQLGVPAPQVVAVSVDGAQPDAGGDPNGPDGEVTLDIEIAGALAPAATLAVYFAPNSEAGFADAISQALHDKTHQPSVLSISWGAPEARWSAQALGALDDALQTAVALGVTVCAAAGDSGSGDGVGDGASHVDFPASSLHALGCGGTRLTATAGRIARETVWNDAGGGATGGGISASMPLPPWQRGLAVHGGGKTQALTRRGVPDVAANADPSTGYVVRIGGTNMPIGGTSAVAPLWAALIARINAARGQPAGFVNAALYAHAQAFNDITQGGNGRYAAAAGWDACTGLGSPRGMQVAAALGASQPGASTAPNQPSKKENNMGTTATPSGSRDQPLFDPTAYGNGPDDAVTDASENAAITHHSVRIGGQTIAYVATAGHLVAVDPSSSQPSAKFFYVAFTRPGLKPETRPLTFFYNGGPGSSSVFVLLGSFAPRRIKTSMPSFTPPAPYTMEDNPDSLLDESDLVFINPVGTGYSAAVAPRRNREFWGVDQDADSIKQFIKRYLTANDRWNSPKFLFGESYGTARSCVLAYRLHEDGVDLNGVTLQSSILDYTQAGNPMGALPTAAADAFYHHRLGLKPAPTDLSAFADQVAQFARTGYAQALRKFPAPGNAAVAAALKQMAQYTGIDTQTLGSWSMDIAAYDNRGHSLFLITLLKDQGLAVGAYDGRVTAVNTGIAGNIDPNSGGNDPTMTAVSGVYTAMWNHYLNDELKFTCNSSFTDLNDQAFQNWDFGHIDPTGAQKGVDARGNVILYTAGDLAAVMSLNPDLKVLSANGYYDFVTPFYQTIIDLQKMPLQSQAIRNNLNATFYPSGHMIYLDGGSRTALKADLARMYRSAVANRPALARVRALQARQRLAVVAG